MSLDAQTRPPASDDSISIEPASAGAPLPSEARIDTNTHGDGASEGPDFRTSHSCLDAHATVAGAEPTPESTHGAPDAHACCGALGADLPATKATTTPRSDPWLADPFLALAADVLDDAEENRKANANRLRHLTRAEVDADGVVRGLGMDESHPDVARLAALVEMLAAVEHQATLNLARLMRAHPLGPWLKAQKGVGDKQAARLLAVVGDPYVNAETGLARTVGQLWAYCGHGDPARRRAKNMSQADLFALGNPTAKMRVHLIAESCIKQVGKPDPNAHPDATYSTGQASRYRLAYEARKAANQGRLHSEPCVRCGPSGHPAAEGSAWSDAHRHADALRIVGKEFLRDLWIESRRLHDERGVS